MLSKLLNFWMNFDTQVKMGSISVVSPISKKISTFLAALFKQLLNFRIYLFLKFFAKSINKLTRGDYVIWGTIVKTKPITEITRFDSIYAQKFSAYNLCAKKIFCAGNRCADIFWLKIFSFWKIPVTLFREGGGVCSYREIYILSISWKKLNLRFDE